MYPGWVGVLLSLGILTWLIFITYIVYKDRKIFVRLFHNRSEVKLKLEDLLTKLEEVDQFKKQSSGFIQKVSLKRYNPYRDTGGDQSFSVAILDAKGDGVVVSSLHSRAGTRVFAKSVVAGKQSGTEFSREEKLVVEDAINN